MMVIDNKYQLGDFVYLKTDKEQIKRIVFAIKITPAGLIYSLSAGTINSDHYEFEMTEEQDLILKTTE